MLGFVGEEGRGYIEGGRGKVDDVVGVEGMEEVWQSGTDRGRRRLKRPTPPSISVFASANLSLRQPTLDPPLPTVPPPSPPQKHHIVNHGKHLPYPCVITHQRPSLLTPLSFHDSFLGLLIPWIRHLPPRPQTISPAPCSTILSMSPVHTRLLQHACYWLYLLPTRLLECSLDSTHLCKTPPTTSL